MVTVKDKALIWRIWFVKLFLQNLKLNTSFLLPPDTLFSAVKNFSEVAASFHERLQQIDINKYV